ncbi:terminase large subunit domain-containing protein [Rhizobium rosettiformans]|uniref:terminase large subunit domain-containing protein n=1 Tax=Rhizobium rosettiformans TaxID=1368430 RepID=UPI002855610B|nr:terminase large subunit [Rhizobium rosettiformans]MDR7029820.1 hypothetical protein [Rhizobium rosettiformans]MDR7063534.1 hypothetical protein [Rhizobium rosettiformans]
MISLDLAAALDPAHFMTSTGLIPDPWQRRFLRSTVSRLLLLCARQTGKSTTTAALAAHCALYEPGALILLLSPSQQQSRELFRKVTEFVRGLANLDLEAESASRIEFPNGSRIVCLSGNPLTVRGFSAPRLIIIDEAAFIDDELAHSVTPMLAGGGRLIAMSTPNGRRGWFYENWISNDPLWERMRVTASDSPRISAEFLATERASKPEWRIRQEYGVEFVDTDETLFPAETVAAAITPAVTPLFGTGFSAFSGDQ